MAVFGWFHWCAASHRHERGQADDQPAYTIPYHPISPSYHIFLKQKSLSRRKASLESLAMFSSFGQIPLSVPKFGFGRTPSTGPVNIAPVTVHDVETIPDKRARRLKHLLKLNHANFSILYNKLRFHNHTPHVGSLSFPPYSPSQIEHCLIECSP